MLNNKNDELNLEIELLRKQKLQSLGQFACGISHHLNNMLMPVVCFLEFNREQNQNGQSKVDSPFLSNVEDTLSNILELSYKVALYSQDYTADSKTLPVIKLVKYIEEIKDSIQFQIPFEIMFQNLVQKKLQAIIPEKKLGMLIENLLFNARDALEEKAAVSTIKNQKIDVVLSHKQFYFHDKIICNTCASHIEGNYLSLSVQDEGVGIEPENFSFIFDPFFTTKEVGKGDGLGLAIVSGIMNSLRGHVLVKTGEQTTFELLFPCV